MRQPVAVYWLDACGSREDQAVDPIPSVTLGFITEMTDQKLTVASELNEDEPRDFTTIPRGMVICVKKLRKIHTPQDVHAHFQKPKKGKRVSKKILR